jgi:hypothetical protein
MRGSSGLRWFKSSYSGTSGGECVEAAAAPGIAYVRDSKNTHGPVLRFSREVWSEFVAYATETGTDAHV